MPPRRTANQRRVAKKDELNRRIEQIIDNRLVVALERDVNIFTEEDLSDDAFFIVGGDGEPKFDEEEETKGQEDTILPNDGEFVADSFGNGSNWDFYQCDDADVGDGDTSFVDLAVPHHIEENENFGFRKLESDEGDDFDDANSGARSDDFDLLELGLKIVLVPNMDAIEP
ncbi:hypothetical protein CDL15_Pgr016325 [Punica granatum]|uniref:Uncharacterized protein n=1 Tax=Punica granatum TaxID=22663 RepID=A0A218W5T2_PUNGR|nr:hypothetical protein CDL15_Pgr016325 [Punica granatum]PKI44122.1 hypothetical protein CRG98_035466 [Punica granatum]